MTHARLGALNVAWWRDAPDLEQMALLTQNIDRSKPFVFVNVVFGGTRRFSQPVRKAVKELCENTQSRHGLAHVVLMTGLAGSAVRMFLHRAAWHCPDQVVMSSLDEVVPWVLDRLDEIWTEGEVLSALKFQAARAV